MKWGVKQKTRSTLGLIYGQERKKTQMASVEIHNAMQALPDDLQEDIRFARRFLNTAEMAIDAEDEYPRLHPDGEPMTDNRGNTLVSTNKTAERAQQRARDMWTEYITPSTPETENAPTPVPTPRKRAASKAADQ
jgi:hypothetical protein